MGWLSPGPMKTAFAGYVEGGGKLYVTDFVGTLTKLSVNVGALKVTASTPVTTTVMNTGNLGLTITALTFAI